MNKTVKKILQYSIFLGLGIFLTYWQYSGMKEKDKVDFVKSIREAQYIYLIPVFFMAIISHISRSIRWRYLMQPMGYNPSLVNSFATVMIGYLVNTLAPRAGEVVKCTLLGKREKIPVDKLIGTILIERAIDLLCYFFIIVITVVLQYEKISTFMVAVYHKAVDESATHPLLKMGIYIAVLIVVIFILKWLFKKYKNNAIFDKIKDSLHGVKDGFQSIKKLEKKKLFWFHTFIIWACYLLQIYVGFRAMEFTAHLGIDAAFGVLALGTLAMILTPGGIGSFPIAVMNVLLLYNIAEAQGTAFGWAIWGASTSIIVVVGIICFIWFEINKSRHEKQRIQST